ncbi:MAG: regulatory protein RecX [Candidatus Absconditabacterales bacterium]
MKPCYDYAISYLYRFPKTEQDLRIKLYQKGYPSSDVDMTMQNLKKKGYIDDKIYAESYVRSDVVKKGKPAFLLKKKLEQKGIDRSILDEVFKAYEGDMQEGIEGRIKKEIEGYKKRGVDGFDIIQKLMRKGYKLDDIKRVIENK